MPCRRKRISQYYSEGILLRFCISEDLFPLLLRPSELPNSKNKCNYQPRKVYFFFLPCFCFWGLSLPDQVALRGRSLGRCNWLSPTLFREFTNLNREWILLPHPRPPMLGAGLEASSHLFGTSFWGPNPERGNREVPCLSESLSFYAESLAFLVFGTRRL